MKWDMVMQCLQNYTVLFVVKLGFWIFNAQKKDQNQDLQREKEIHDPAQAPKLVPSCLSQNMHD